MDDSMKGHVPSRMLIEQLSAMQKESMRDAFGRLGYGTTFPQRCCSWGRSLTEMQTTTTCFRLASSRALLRLAPEQEGVGLIGLV